MIRTLIELTNAAGDRWIGWVWTGLLDSVVLLIIVSLIWFTIRQRVSPQLGYCLFFLVLLKLILPLHVAVPTETARWIPSVVVSNWWQTGSDHPVMEHDGPPETAVAISGPTVVNSSEAISLETSATSTMTRSVKIDEKPVVPRPADTQQIFDQLPESAKMAPAMAPRLSIAAAGILVWLAVVTGLSVRLFVSQLRFSRRLNQLQDSTEAQIDLELDALRRRVGVSREVRLLCSDDVTAPAVWGIVRPVIILPKRIAASLSPDQLQWVLLHELAHIRRRDLLAVFLQRLVAIAQCFNPAVWIANRMIHRLREYACDDLATLHSDGPATTSSEAFLQVLRQANLRDRRLNAALGVFGFDSRSACYARVGRLLDTERSIRIGLDRWSACGLILLSAAVLPHLYAQQSADNPANVSSNVDAVANTDGEKADTPQPKTAGPLAKDVGQFELSVTDANGKAVPDIQVEFRGEAVPAAEQVHVGKFVSQGDQRAVVATNAEGRLAIVTPKDPGRFEFRIVAPGCAPYRMAWGWAKDAPQTPAKFTVQLKQGKSFGGTVVDEAGKPVQGAIVHLRMTFNRVPGEKSAHGVGASVTTDASGQWHYDGISAQSRTVSVTVKHPDYVTLDHDFSVQSDQPDTDSESSRQVVLRRGYAIRGNVTDEAGQPIAGAKLRTRLPVTSLRTRLDQFREVTTDAEGRYQVAGLPHNSIRLVVSAAGRAPEMKDIQIEGERSQVNFQLPPGRTIRVRVLDENDNPIPKARVHFRGWRGDFFHYFEFDHVNRRADQDGVWVWKDAPNDAIQADICPPKGICLPQRTLTPRDEEYVFRLPKSLVITGSVVDAASKEPVKSLNVTIGQRANNPEPVPSSVHTMVRATGTDGKYRIEDTKGPYAADMIQIDAPGYRATEWKRIVYGDAGTAQIDAELKKAPVNPAVGRVGESAPPKDESKSEKPTQSATASSLPADCEQALKRDVQSLSTCRLKYSIQMELPSKPAGVPGRPNRAIEVCVLDQGLFYRSCERHFPDDPRRGRPGQISLEEMSYDGQVFYFGTSSRFLTKYLGENQKHDKAAVRAVQVPYLEASGFFVPQTAAEWRTGKFDAFPLMAMKEGKLLKLTADASTLQLDFEVPDPSILMARRLDLEKMFTPSRGGEPSEAGKKRIEAIRESSKKDPIRHVQLKLDREKGFALKHREDRTPDGKLISTYDCEDLEFFPMAQLWLPRTCVKQEFAAVYLTDFNDEPLEITRIKLDDISFAKPDDVSFKINYGPRVLVQDYSIPGSENVKGE